MLDSNRAGELTAHGFAKSGGGCGRDQVPPLTADEARAAAASEGLELELSNLSETGFKGVSKNGSRYVAQVREIGTLRNLGTFATPEEAALCYARSIGAVRAVRAAAAEEARAKGPRPLTEDEVRAIAASEGLELVPSDDCATGFKGVTKHHGKYQAKVKENGKRLHLGSFVTAGEAALCCARRVKDYRMWAEAAEVAAGHHVKKQKA